MLSVAAAAFIAGEALPHHSPVMFDQSQPKTLTGTVREFQWTNPHAYIQLLVKNEQGQEEEWSLEMGASVYLYNLGWRPSSVKASERLRKVSDDRIEGEMTIEPPKDEPQE
jgi:hypothetical protein